MDYCHWFGGGFTTIGCYWNMAELSWFYSRLNTDVEKEMNALEEIIEHLENAKYIGASKAATMLRTIPVLEADNLKYKEWAEYLEKKADAFYAEIERLKKIIESLEYFSYKTKPIKQEKPKIDEDFDAVCLENKRLLAEIEALKAENQFFKDVMGDVEILRKEHE